MSRPSSRLRALLPHPVLSAALLIAWLLMAELTVAHLVLAIVLAAALPWVVRRFFGEPFGHARRPHAAGLAVRFTLLVLWDIVVANVVVARLVLGPVARLRPAFIEIPLELEEPLAIALLASIITMTPGTVSADLSDDRRRLLVHVLDTGDPQGLVGEIKTRYERPLKEIFS